MRSAQAVYLSGGGETPLRRRFSPLPLLLMTLVAIMVALQAFTPFSLSGSSAPSETSVAQADGFKIPIACSNDKNIGFFTTKKDWGSLLGRPQPDAGGRTWTLQEAYGAGLSFTGYNGEGDGTFWTPSVGKERGKGIGEWEKYLKKLEEPRTLPDCIVGGAFLIMGNAMLKTADAISSLVQGVAVFAFDPNIICQDPAKPEGVCINLIGILAGKNDAPGGSMNQGGIIGSLTAGVFLPMSVFVVALAAMSVMWTGIVKRQFRKAFQNILWVFVSFILGLAILLNPTTMTRIPMVVGNAITTCVVGAFNGQNCMTGGASDSKYDNESDKIKDICVSEANGISLDKQMSMTVNSLTCSIWKAFVLEPWSQGQFGRSYEEMETDNPEIKKALEEAGLDASEFEVSLGSSASMNSMEGKMLNMDTGPKVSNIAAYQLYLRTNAKSAAETDALGHNFEDPHGELDKRWLRIAVFSAGAGGDVWNSWATLAGSSMGKIGLGIMALITSVFGGAIIAVVSVMALVYLITSIVMMAFAPLFILVGIHPGRGRTIMLGWLEHIVSNILKYMASAFYLIITIALYGGIMQSVEGIWEAFIFVFIITMALWLYRKEIVDLMGRVNLGGQRLSSTMGDRLSKMAKSRVDRTKRMGTATTAGAIGSVMATGSVNPFKHAGAAMQGMKSSAKRDLRRGNGMVAQTFREADRMATDNRNDMRNMGKSAERRVQVSAEDVKYKRDNYDAVKGVAAEEAKRLKNGQAQYVDSKGKEKKAKKLEMDMLMNLKMGEPMKLEYDLIGREMLVRGKMAGDAIAAGDMEGAKAHRAEMVELQGRLNGIDAFRGHSDVDRSAAAEVVAAELRLAQLQRERAKHINDPATLKLIDADIAAAQSDINTYGIKVTDPQAIEAARELYGNELAEKYETEGLGRNFDREGSLDDVEKYERLQASYENHEGQVMEAHNQWVAAESKLVEDRAVAETYTKAVNDMRPGDTMTGKRRLKIEEEARQLAQERMDLLVDENRQVAEEETPDYTDPAKGFAVNDMRPGDTMTGKRRLKIEEEARQLAQERMAPLVDENRQVAEEETPDYTDPAKGFAVNVVTDEQRDDLYRGLGTNPLKEVARLPGAPDGKSLVNDDQELSRIGASYQKNIDAAKADAEAAKKAGDKDAYQEARRSAIENERVARAAEEVRLHTPDARATALESYNNKQELKNAETDLRATVSNPQASAAEVSAAQANVSKFKKENVRLGDRLKNMNATSAAPAMERVMNDAVRRHAAEAAAAAATGAAGAATGIPVPPPPTGGGQPTGKRRTRWDVHQNGPSGGNASGGGNP